MVLAVLSPSFILPIMALFLIIDFILVLFLFCLSYNNCNDTLFVYLRFLLVYFLFIFQNHYYSDFDCNSAFVFFSSAKMIDYTLPVFSVYK